MPLTPKGEKILKSMEATYGPEKGEQVLYASKNAGTITGIDAMAGQPGPFGQANPFDCDQAMPPIAPTVVDLDDIGADPGLPIPIFEHPQQHPGESTPPEPAVAGGAADSTGAFYGGRDVNGGISGGALRQDWGEGSPWPNVGDAMPASVGIADIQRQAEDFMAQWMPRPLGPDQK